jgi:hypothetical protein
VAKVLNFVVFTYVHQLFKFTIIPTYALHHNITCTTTPTCFDPFWVIHRKCTSIFVYAGAIQVLPVIHVARRTGI